MIVLTFTLKISNATQHESGAPQQTAQLLYWENLKCLGEIWRMRQKFSVTQEGQRGFGLGFDQSWSKVDQGGSLGVVGDVFEVMDQVDHRLTKVNSFDPIVRVNEPRWKPGASQPTTQHMFPHAKSFFLHAWNQLHGAKPHGFVVIVPFVPYLSAAFIPIHENYPKPPAPSTLMVSLTNVPSPEINKYKQIKWCPTWQTNGKEN
jgi:hypothetical protein